jgi:DNA repair exonuclease SbcCD ATPase subunit
MIPNLTVDAVKDRDPLLHAKYVSEQERVTQELAIVYEKISKDKKLSDAFRKLQDAENVRDEAPNAYQQARAAYYTLKEGETWKEKERERLMKAEVEPLTQKLVDTRNEALRQYENQRKTVDVVNGLKDRVLSLKDEVKYAADTFKEQLNKVQDAINRERRGRATETTVSIWDWMDTILNLAIIGALLYVIYLLYKKFSVRPPQPAVIIRG